jgi:general stress protein 26
MKEELEKKIVEYVEKRKVCSLATVREDGYPQNTIVGYVNDGLIFYAGCFKDSQKVANIRRNPCVSLTVGEESPNLSYTKGISLGGDAHLLDDPKAIEEISRLFNKKFPYVNSFPLEQLVWIQIVPKVIHFVDYSLGIGHQDVLAVR